MYVCIHVMTCVASDVLRTVVVYTAVDYCTLWWGHEWVVCIRMVQGSGNVFPLRW